ncbi:Small glutamine-rich tetratricopeptide repeat-containing protein 2 [Leucoagaricus sp. SymC.cos]|nr:Small glutamine-rich tetratricopeptide repeat-containing protein 2 [Leucoagaricus sp. SymC.cos]
MDAAGLAISVVALWQSCVQVFEVINFGRHYGMDYEILSIKLEVERVRLLSWGHAAGLNDVTNADTRLGQIEIHGAVIRLLGCIQHVFEDSEQLQNTYGLRLSVTAPEEGGFEARDEQPSQSRMILGGVFKRAYENLRRAALERQRNTPVIRKSKWAVHDRSKFMALVAEVRGFNDSLESLFPDVKLRMMEAMRRDIDEAVQVRDLQLLQEATAGEEGLEDISERASVRLEALGATVSARTELLSDSSRSTPTDSGEKEADGNERDAERETVKDGEEEVPRGDKPAENKGEPTDAGEQEQDELSKKLRDIELYVQKKSTGALTLSRIGPFGSLAHCSAHVYWDGDESGDDRSNFWVDKDKGFVPMLHACFDLYKKKKYMHKPHRDRYESLDSEDYVLLDPESHIKFENTNPGTVTVEGYGLECWEFESQKPREHTILVNSSRLPDLSASRLLRRIDELQTDPGKFGWNPDQEELDLKQVVGTLGITYYNPAYEKDRNRWVGDLYSVLNRTDIFADFTKESSIGLQWTAPASKHSIGIWNFLRQVIVAWELTTRLKYLGGGGYMGFTPRILASLIVSDLWLKHVKIVLRDAIVHKVNLKKPETAMEKAKAEGFKNMADEAFKRKEYQRASDLYTEALRIDLTNAVYRCNRAAAQLALENWMNAEEDAYIATQLDPTYAKAWSRLGMARLKQGYGKRAEKAYGKALQVAGKDATAAMQQGLADAKAKIAETINAIKTETDQAKRHTLRSDFVDEDFEMLGKEPEFHSLIHGQQVEGLLLFAEKIKWPYMNEVRDYAEDVYSELRGGGTVDVHLHDWLFGLVLPGKWFAFKIMSALILCTPGLKDTVGVAYYYDCGLSVSRRSYWRCRTILGRVLGCLPGVQGLCGWIGPCPPVEFDPPLEDPQKPRHIRLLARRITPFDHKADINDHDRIYVWEDRNQATDIQPNEEINPYIADMKDSSQWIVPEPPVHDVSTCQLKSIKLRKLPLDVKFAGSGMSDLDVEEIEYRASLEFTMDDNPSRPVTYKLLTNPVFVTPPPCRPGPKGPHEVHMRELPRYQKNIWSVGQLKDHVNWDESDAESQDVMIINATGKGAEVLARAWCSERGRNAVIRRAGGPCFVCAVRAASKRGLGLGTLIWVG